MREREREREKRLKSRWRTGLRSYTLRFPLPEAPSLSSISLVRSTPSERFTSQGTQQESKARRLPNPESFAFHDTMWRAANTIRYRGAPSLPGVIAKRWGIHGGGSESWQTTTEAAATIHPSPDHWINLGLLLGRKSQQRRDQPCALHRPGLSRVHYIFWCSTIR